MPNAHPQQTLSEIGALATPALRPLCEQLRKVIFALHPDAYETVWPKLRIASFGLGPKKMTEHYAYIGVQKDHVNLGFYYGTTLPDPDGLLEGTGKTLRHLKLRPTATPSPTAIKALLRAAIAERRRALA